MLIRFKFYPLKYYSLNITDYVGNSSLFVVTLSTYITAFTTMRFSPEKNRENVSQHLLPNEYRMTRLKQLNHILVLSIFCDAVLKIKIPCCVPIV